MKPASTIAGRPAKLTLSEWDRHYDDLKRQGLSEPIYGGRLSRHVAEGGDLRLRHLQFDSSPAGLRLWNFLLTENQRLRSARAAGDRIVGAMKDLGTLPVMASSLQRLRAFYPDGAWWTPCLMECSDHLLHDAEKMGIDASFCPVRALLPAFHNEEHFPRPDVLICSTGAVCDDFSAIAQRLERTGFPVVWWEMPRRRVPEPGEAACELPGGFAAPLQQVRCVEQELRRVGRRLEELSGERLDDYALAGGIRKANEVRRILQRLRNAVYGAAGILLPALEMLIAEMLAIHFCSDQTESREVLSDLLGTVESRRRSADWGFGQDAVRIFWVNPVADLRAMNLLEDLGGRICGTDFMFTHALDLIPEELPPFEALARTALADPMVGSSRERARRIGADCRAFGAEALVVSRIPGASHCASEGVVIREAVGEQLGIPTIELEIPPVCDAMMPTLRSRFEAVMETAKARRESARETT